MDPDRNRWPGVVIFGEFLMFMLFIAWTILGVLPWQ